MFLLASLFFDTYCYNISQVITLLTYIFSQAFALLCTLKVTYRYSYVTLMTHYYNISTTRVYNLSVHESVKGLKMWTLSQYYYRLWHFAPIYIHLHLFVTNSTIYMLQDITRPISTINKLCHNYLKMCDIFTLIMLQHFTYYTLTMLPSWLQKFSNRKLYQSQKLPNKATLSRKWPIIASFMTDKTITYWFSMVYHFNNVLTK